MTAESIDRFAHGLETVLPLEPTQNYFQLLGWVHAPGASTTTRIRVVIDREPHDPVERISRPDVAAAFPDDAGAGNSGFKFLSYLPYGFYHGTLEASDDDGATWHHIRTLAFPVSPHPLRGGIDSHAAGSVITAPARLEGWCFHPEFEVSEVVLQFGNVEVPCEYHLPRADVADRFPAHPTASRCGFISRENLPRGTGTVKVRAVTTCGRVYFVHTEIRTKIEQGWYPNPPPPSPVPDLSTAAWSSPDASSAADRGATGRIKAGGANILFVLYGDFASNSALHVAALANRLIDLGYDCVVAVPANKETVGALPRATFMAIEFDELPSLPAYFKDGAGPCLVHAWTPREMVRRFCGRVSDTFETSLIVHVEDNEFEIVESRLGRSVNELTTLDPVELDGLIPLELTHPTRGPQFLRDAAGATAIVKKLRDHIPATTPSHIIWPAADETNFKALPRNNDLRLALGIAPSTVVVFYHGNTHTSNDAEVRNLYEAIRLLNETGQPAQLIRTGRDYPDFSGQQDDKFRPYLVHLGHIGRARHLPPLMAMADYFVQPGLPGAFNDYRFPSKIPEFFAIGRPVILPASNIGSLLKHQQDAWVLPNADAPSIAEAIRQLQADEPLRNRLADGALKFSRSHFSWRRSTDQLVAFYQSLTPLVAPSTLSD